MGHRKRQLLLQVLQRPKGPPANVQRVCPLSPAVGYRGLVVAKAHYPQAIGPHHARSSALAVCGGPPSVVGHRAEAGPPIPPDAVPHGHRQGPVGQVEKGDAAVILEAPGDLRLGDKAPRLRSCAGRSGHRPPQARPPDLKPELPRDRCRYRLGRVHGICLHIDGLVLEEGLKGIDHTRSCGTKTQVDNREAGHAVKLTPRGSIPGV